MLVAFAACLVHTPACLYWKEQLRSFVLGAETLAMDVTRQEALLQ